MAVIRIVVIVASLLACGCGRGPTRNEAGAGAVPNEAAQATPASGSQAAGASQASAASQPADATRALDEFEPMGTADVELYLKVLRAAAERVKNMSTADRDALKVMRDMTSGANAGQIPSPEQIAAMQRAGDLLALDRVVAREMGVDRRYSSIASRVPKFGMPEMSGEGDDEPMTAEQRAALKLRIQRFRQRRAADAAMFEPHRQEVEALQKQVDLIAHPESVRR